MKYHKLISIFNVVVIVVLMPIFFLGVRELGVYLGLVETAVPVAGTGSMYPSLFWTKQEGGPDDLQHSTVSSARLEPHMYHYFRGLTIFRSRLLASELGRGDMVAFKNQKTKEVLEEEGKSSDAGFIKRIIGLPGDKIELKNGYLYLNNEPQLEPYIANGRSTYGGSSLADCTPITVPPDHYFVLGDNRKLSSDSRGELGFIKDQDILYYLPFSKQSLYRSLWRDASHDLTLSQSPTLDISQAITLINAYRSSNQKPTLAPSPTLNKSASLRGKKILLTNDFTTEATVSGYTFAKAMDDARYSNILTGEVVSHGFYNAEEWVQNLTYFASTAKQLQQKDYDDIGIAVETADVNGCPTQVIVGHFGGYLPPQYSQETLASWQKLRNNLEDVLPGWREALTYEGIDQAKLRRLIQILEGRLSLAIEIEETMQNLKWLTKTQEDRISSDQALAQEAESIINQLNNQ